VTPDQQDHQHGHERDRQDRCSHHGERLRQGQRPEHPPLLRLQQRLKPESQSPISRLFSWIHEPILNLALRWKWAALLVNFTLIPLTVPLLFLIGSEFMPPLFEGSLLYMPTSPPGLSIAESTRLLGAGQDAPDVS
jgi:Cu/Ag efflux pump CusA